MFSQMHSALMKKNHTSPVIVPRSLFLWPRSSLSGCVKVAIYTIQQQELLECTEQRDDISESKILPKGLFSSLLLRHLKQTAAVRPVCSILISLSPNYLADHERPGSFSFFFSSKWAFNEHLGHFCHWAHTLFICHPPPPPHTHRHTSSE